MVEETDIAVVGAGGGGAVLALALAQKGIKTVVFEQAPGTPQGLRGENDYSTATLKRYEASRRPHVTMLQKLADEQVLFWNTANPIIAFLRDRVFSTLDRNARLRYRVLSTTAGLRKEPPFGIMDRLMAAGLLPDYSVGDRAARGMS